MLYTEKKRWAKGTAAKVVRLRVSQISPNPNQPRKVFDEDSLHELASSIRTYGVIQPITVTRIAPDRYQLIMGERRLRASQLAHMEDIPCIVVDTDEKDSAVLALIENLQRQNLSFFEEAMAIKNIMQKTGITQNEAAKLISKTQPAVANKLRLLKIAPEHQRLIEENGLSERHARALLRLEENELRDKALRLVISKFKRGADRSAH